MMQSREVRRLVFGFMVVMFVASAYGSNECTYEKVTTCFAMVNNSVSGVDRLVQSNATQMRAICTTYDKSEDCIEPLKSNCSKTHLHQIETFESGFSLICEKKNLQDYLKHADCFLKMNLEKTAAPCKREFFKDVYRDKTDMKRICQDFRDALDCIVKPISSKCGEDAARFMHRMLLRYSKSSGNGLDDCDLSGSTSRFVNSVMVTVLAVMVLPVLTLLGL